MRLSSACAALVAVIAVMCSGVARAAILRVNPQASGPAQDGSSWANAFRSLQPALDAAVPGDEVWIAAGAYAGSHSVKAGVMVLGGFAGTETTRVGRDIAANPTIVDGGGTATALVVQPGTAATLVEGLTIRRGAPVGLAATDAVLLVSECCITENGSGITVSGAATILKSRITDNSAASGINVFGNLEVDECVVTGNGAGIATTGGVTTILRSTVSRNRSTGISIGSSARSPTIINGNRIERNAEGGLRAAGGGPQIIGNFVRNNTTSGDGAGIAITSGPAVIADNVISGNVSGAMGGGILAGATASATVRITNNTLANNVAAVRGGGIHVSGVLGGGGTVRVENTVIAYNRGGLSRLGPADVQVRYCDVFANADDFQGVPNPGAANGNLSVEPRFADPSLNDLHLQPTSPLRDAGSNALVFGNAADIDRQPRVFPEGGTVDIGADESDGTEYAVERAVVRVRPDGDDASDGSTWALAKRTVQAAVDVLDRSDGGEVWVAEGVYNEMITLGSAVHLFGGFSGTEQSRPQADPVAHPTILDGGAVGSVVTIPFGAGGGQTIAGLTIRHRTKSGIGIEAHTASLYLADTTITSHDVALQSDNAIVTTKFVRLSGGKVGVNGVMSGFLEDAEIQDNTAAGVQVIAPNLTVRGNIIAGNGVGLEAHGTVTVDGNTVLNNTGAYGIRLTGTPRVTNNSVRGNGTGIHISGGRAESVAHNVVNSNRERGLHLEQFNGAQPRVERNVLNGNLGGGLYLSGGMPHVLSNTIRDNVTNGNGAGIEVASGGPILANNVVAGNEASGRGGGLYLMASESADFLKVINNTIVANRASDGAGGIHITGSAPLQGTVFAANNIVAWNSLGIENSAGPVTTVLRFNDVFGNGTDYHGLPDPTGAEGNVSVDPGFIGPGTADLRLKPQSPLRNAGDTTAVQGGWTDIEGEERRQEVAVDIGADEVAAVPYGMADVRWALYLAGGMQVAGTGTASRLDVFPGLGTNGGRTGDGRVTASDAIRILRFVNGLETP